MARACAGIHVLETKQFQRCGWPGQAQGCPVILIDEVHGIDSSWIQTFWPTFWFQPESNAMPLQATVFSQLLQHIPWATFEDAVATHKADKGVRTLDARSPLAVDGRPIDRGSRVARH